MIDNVMLTAKLHTVSPYIGKMRPEIASWAVNTVTEKGESIYDPFCGSGTVLLEGWISGRHVIGTDLNPYACLISKAKMHPYDEKTISKLDSLLDSYASEASAISNCIDVESVDEWVRSFYNPQTLVDLLSWIKVLEKHNDSFALACLMGIAHHQRPGFLSYPSSHTTPYLRTNKFPRDTYPELYEYRDVLSRLKKKIIRACSKNPYLDYSLDREVLLEDASILHPNRLVDAIITSPPYMGQLDYARDNRLRLKLLGIDNWQELNKDISPRAAQFVDHMGKCLDSWRNVLKPGGKLAILVGTTTNTVKHRLDELVIEMVSDKWTDYHLKDVIISDIPDARRARKNCKGSISESLLLFDFRG
ncbi:DNA methyltransferase [Yersinia proxima]|uniref:DNA methyltransferase n=1 Tax=Yersinia proxima TaxID=2890316 RepID=UPI001D1147E4|nr:DNA methyltransferase [Yersinia proxima]